MAIIGLRIPDELRRSLEEDAKKSGWSLSEQVRYELSKLRGMEKTPYFPTGVRPPEE